VRKAFAAFYMYMALAEDRLWMLLARLLLLSGSGGLSKAVERQ
jgi:hypothetical protein